MTSSTSWRRRTTRRSRGSPSVWAHAAPSRSRRSRPSRSRRSSAPSAKRPNRAAAISLRAERELARPERPPPLGFEWLLVADHGLVARRRRRLLGVRAAPDPLGDRRRVEVHHRLGTAGPRGLRPPELHTHRHPPRYV